MMRLLCIGGACDGEWHFVPETFVKQGETVSVAERLGPHASMDRRKSRKIHQYQVEEFREDHTTFHVLIDPSIKGRVFQRLIRRYVHRP